MCDTSLHQAPTAGRALGQVFPMGFYFFSDFHMEYTVELKALNHLTIRIQLQSDGTGSWSLI